MPEIKDSAATIEVKKLSAYLWVVLKNSRIVARFDNGEDAYTLAIEMYKQKESYFFELPIINLTTNEVYANADECAKHFNVDRRHVLTCLRRGRRIKKQLCMYR